MRQKGAPDAHPFLFFTAPMKEESNGYGGQDPACRRGGDRGGGAAEHFTVYNDYGTITDFEARLILI